MLPNILIGIASAISVAIVMTLISLSIGFSGWSFWYLTVIPLVSFLALLTADQLEPLYFHVMDIMYKAFD